MKLVMMAIKIWASISIPCPIFCMRCGINWWCLHFFWWPYRSSDMEKVLVKVRMEELLEVGLVELSKGEYALTTIMFFQERYFWWLDWTLECGDDKLWSTSKYNLTNMPCHCLEGSKKILLAMLKCLTFWIYDLDIISCLFVKVTKWRLQFGALTKMEGTICINESFYLLGWRKHLQSSKRWWIDFL